VATTPIGEAVTLYSNGNVYVQGLAGPLSVIGEGGQDTAICVCDGCGKKLKVKAPLAGKTVKCPQCGTNMMVPVPKA